MDDEDGFRTTPATSKPLRTVVLDFVGQHLPLVASVSAGFSVSLRCIIAARGDLYTSFLLLTLTTVGDAIRGLLFVSMSAILQVVSVVTAFLAGSRGRRLDLGTIGLVAVSVITAIGHVWFAHPISVQVGC